MHPTLNNFIPVAKLISQTFDCEVILHDFSTPQSSVVYIENNIVTNRAVGESFTEYFVKEVLLSRKFHDDCCDPTRLSNVIADLSRILGIPETTAHTGTEQNEVIPSIQELVNDIIDKTIGDRDVENMSRDQKIDIIRFMYDKEIFMIKGTLEKVAERMNLSKVTIYSYLDEIRKNDNH